MKSTTAAPHFKGGPSGIPVTLMMPDEACTVRSIAIQSRFGPESP
jgi:hypothetical protein